MTGKPAQVNRTRILAPAVLVLLGIFWRLVWLWRQHPFAVSQVEASNAAIAFARTGRFADAIGPGEGLTAHLNPVMPVFSGIVYRVLGIQAPVADWFLSLVALGLSIGSALFLYRLFGLMGATRNGRLLGLGSYCLLPLAPFTELMEFRHWEGGLAVFLATGLLALILKTDCDGVTSWSRRLSIALLAAVLFFINPPLGLAGYVMTAILLWRRMSWRTYPATVGAAICVLFAVLAPWTIRNYEAFGYFIPVRGNAGLEVALANHAAAVSGDDQRIVFLSRLQAIHPNGNPVVFARMKAMGGEIPYAAMLGRQADSWIATHPAQFLLVSLRHVADFYFPPAWLWSVYGSFSRGTLIKQALMWATALLGLIGAVMAAVVWRGRFLYPATLALMPALPYAIVQPILRYHYLVVAVLLFLAAELVSRAIHQFMTARNERRLEHGSSGEPGSPALRMQPD